MCSRGIGVPPKLTGGYQFEELERQLRNYLAEVTDDAHATQALRKIQAAQSKVRRTTQLVTRDSLAKAAKAGFEIRDGTVREPQPSDGQDRPPTEPVISTPHGEATRARRVQANLLPKEPPAISGIDVACFNRFCHDVGGDYYDFIALPQGRVGIIVADVSGKGVPAAMVMVMLRSILRMVAANGHTAVDTIIHTNRLLTRDLLRGMFVTALYAVIDPNVREMTLVNAGHHAPLIWRPRLSGTRMINVRGPALGLLSADRFAQSIQGKTLGLEQGDCFCLFTDGVSEAKNLLGEEFGTRRLAHVFREHGNKHAQQIVQALVDAVDGFSENTPQHDDITLLVARKV